MANPPPMVWLWLCAVSESRRVSVAPLCEDSGTEEEGAESRVSHKQPDKRRRLHLRLPERGWFARQCQEYPASVAEGATKGACAAIALVRVVPGLLWEGPVTPSWTREARLAQEYWESVSTGNAEAAFSVKVVDVRVLRVPKRLQLCKPLGRERVRAIRRNNVVFRPIEVTGMEKVEGGSGRADCLAGEVLGEQPLAATLAVQLPEPFARMVARRVWSELLLVANWEFSVQVFRDFPPADWVRQALEARSARRAKVAASAGATVSFDAGMFRGWADKIRSCAGSVAAAPGPVPQPERGAVVERPPAPAPVEVLKTELAELVVWLEDSAAALEKSGRENSKARRFVELALLGFHFAATHMRDKGGLAESFNRAAAAAGVNLQQLSGGFPKRSMLYTLPFQVDLALMIEARSSHYGKVAARYLWADSSPQGSRNWLLFQQHSVERSKLVAAMVAANKLVRLSHTADSGEEDRKELEDVLNRSVERHTLVPVALGRAETALVHKCAGLLHSLSLECGARSALDAVIASVASFTTDMGVEMGLGTFRATDVSQLFPVWQRQLQTPLRPDVDGERSSADHSAPQIQADVDGLRGRAPRSSRASGQPGPESPAFQPVTSERAAAAAAVEFSVDIEFLGDEEEEQEVAAAAVLPEKCSAGGQAFAGSAPSRCAAAPAPVSSPGVSAASAGDASPAATLMDQTLARLGLQRVPVPGDGDCQFHALASVLGLPPTSHRLLRKEAVDFIWRRPELFVEALDGLGETLEGYCARMGQQGEWGDNTTLAAIALCRGITVCVIHPHGQMTVVGEDGDGAAARYQCHVCFFPEVHYDATRAVPAAVPAAVGSPPATAAPARAAAAVEVVSPPMAPASDSADGKRSPAAPVESGVAPEVKRPDGHRNVAEAVFRNAISVPGMLHILHNACEDVDAALGCWPEFLRGLRNISALLTERGRRERFIAACLRSSKRRRREKDFTCTCPTLHMQRWGSLVDFMADLKAILPVMRGVWDPVAYGAWTEKSHSDDDGDAAKHGQKKPAADAAAAGFEPALLTSTLKSRFFAAYLDMLLILNAVQRELSAWSEGCTCHESELQGQSRSMVRGDALNCPMRGKRAAELAAGQLRAVLRGIRAQQVEALVLEHCSLLTPQELTDIHQDFEAGCSHIELLLSVKLAFWERLPWHCAGLSHHCEKQAQECAKKCIALFDATPEGLRHMHHPVTLAFLADPAQRRDMEKLASGSPLLSLSPVFQEAVAAMRFIPVVERVVEATHKDVKRRLAAATRHSPSMASSAIRHAETEARVRSDPTFLPRLGNCLRIVRCPWRAALQFGIFRHPAVQGLRANAYGRPLAKKLWQFLGSIIYRCDIDAQFADFSSAAGTHAAAERASKAEAAEAEKAAAAAVKPRARRRPKFGWDTVLAHAFGEHLRIISTQAPSRMLSIAVSNCTDAPIFMELGEALKQTRANLADAFRSATCQLQRDGPELEEQDAGEDLLFFRVVDCKGLGALRQVPSAHAVLEGKLRNQQLAIVPHTPLHWLPATEPKVAAVPMVSFCPLPGEGRARVRVLSNLESVSVDSLQGKVLVWGQGQSVCCIRGFRPGSAEVASAASDVVERCLRQKAYANVLGGGGGGGDRDVDTEGVADASEEWVHFIEAESPREQAALAALVASGFAERSQQTRLRRSDRTLFSAFRLTQAAMQQLVFARPLQEPRVAHEPRALPLPELTNFELLQVCREKGWQVARATATKRRALFFDCCAVDCAKALYVSGASVRRCYMLALLSADQLREMGIRLIPHYGPDALHQDLLKGRPPPEVQALGLDVDLERGPELAERRRSLEEGSGGNACLMGPESGSGQDSDADDDQSSAGLSEQLETIMDAEQAGVAEGSKLLQGQRWGCFRITPKQPDARKNRYGGWQGSCPFHQKNRGTGCKKFVSIRGPLPEDSDCAKRAVALWCSMAQSFDRQWKHVAVNPALGDAPGWPALDALALVMAAPTCKPVADSVLDAPAASTRGLAAVGGLQPARARKDRPAASTAKPKPKPQAAGKRRAAAAAAAVVPSDSAASSADAAATSSTSSSSSSSSSDSDSD